MGRVRTLPGPARSRAAVGASDVRIILDAFRGIVQALRLGGREGRRSGLSTAQLFALQQIAEHPQASINDVASLTFTHQSSVSVVVQRLVAQDLVVKVASSTDRRRQRLAITAKGRRVLARSPVVVQERLIAALVALPATDRRLLARVLAGVAGAAVPSGRPVAHPPMFFEEEPRIRRTRQADSE